MALVLVMSCTWSLCVQQRQICIAVFPEDFQAHETMQQVIWQPSLLQVAECMNPWKQA